jgi:hypothetical protein
MVAAFSGRDPFLYAALKSLPLAGVEGDAAPLARQLELAEALLAEVAAERATWTSSALLDQAELLKQETLEAEGSAAGDAREAAALRYRLQRKRLVEALARVLAAFLGKPAEA